MKVRTRIFGVMLSLLVGVACTPRDATDSKNKVDPVKPETTENSTAEIDYVSTDFAVAFQAQGTAVFIDVRGDHAFNVEHIEGALSYGLPDIKNGKIPDLPKETMIIAYCGCPHSMSTQAARIFKRHGFSNLYVLDEGFYDWKDKGYPITVDQSRADSLRRMTIRGLAPGLPEKTPIYARHEPTDQLEVGELKADGSFEIHLPFYGLKDGEPINLSVGDRKQLLGFSESDVSITLK